MDSKIDRGFSRPFPLLIEISGTAEKVLDGPALRTHVRSKLRKSNLKSKAIEKNHIVEKAHI